MFRPSFGFLTAAAVLLVLASAALAEDRYWVGLSGDWFDPANWSAIAGGPGGAGVPGEGDAVYLTQGDAIGRVVTYSGDSGPASLLSSVRVDATGDGMMSLSVSGGDFHATNVGVAVSGRGEVLQAGGAVRVDSFLTLASGNGSTGTYTLQEGQLASGQTWIYGGVWHPQTAFIQAGGAHTTNVLRLDGTYSLSSGDLTVGRESDIYGLFQHTGGTHTTPWLRVVDHTGGYEWTGGDLNVTAGWVVRDDGSSPSPVPFTFPSSPRTMAINGIVDIGAHTFTNADKVSLQLGPQSLLIVDAGYDPASEFASFSNQGLTHVNGTTLTIPAGRTVTGAG